MKKYHGYPGCLVPAIYLIACIIIVMFAIQSSMSQNRKIKYTGGQVLITKNTRLICVLDSSRKFVLDSIEYSEGK